MRLPRTSRLSPADAQAMAAEFIARRQAMHGDATMRVDAPPADQPPADTPPADTPPADEPPKDDPKTFTQADLDRILGERLSAEKAKHDQALKDAQALAGKNETEKLQTQLEQATTRAQETTQKAAQRIARTEARGAARDLDVRPDRLDAVLKQADLTSAIGEDGEVDDAKVKAAVEKVLADYPEWKKTGYTGPGASGGALDGKGSEKPTFTRRQIEEMPADERVRRIDEINEAMADGRVTG